MSQLPAAAGPWRDSSLPRLEIQVLPDPLVRQRFDLCPICLDPSPDTKEHVPPEATNGRHLTWTCKPCNDGFGSYAEPAYVDWYHTRESDVRIAIEGVQGNRRVGNLNFRMDGDGKPILDFDGRGDIGPFMEAAGAGASRNFVLSGKFWRTVKLAALKSVYLSLCVQQREIPPYEPFDAVREELLAVRGGSLRDDNESDFAPSVSFWRSDEPGQLRGVRLCTAVLPDGQRHAGFLFGSDVAAFSPLVDRVITVVS